MAVDAMAADGPSVMDVSVERGRAMLESGALLLDVREPEEWWAGHAPGALHIPLGELAERLEELPDDVSFVVVCRSGARSRLACEALAGIGANGVNLAGGMQAWAASGGPVVDEEGSRGEVI